MAISVDWPTGVIFVPKADMTQIQTSPFEIRELDLIQFWKDLRALEESEAGRAFPRVLDSAPPSGVLARDIIIRTEYYSVEFDDVSGTDSYRANLSGANSNVADAAILNLVQVRPNNSAGLAQTAKIDDLHSERGLDENDPTTYTQTSTSNNRLTLNHTGDPEVSSTTTRI